MTPPSSNSYLLGGGWVMLGPWLGVGARDEKARLCGAGFVNHMLIFSATLSGNMRFFIQRTARRS